MVSHFSNYMIFFGRAHHPAKTHMNECRKWGGDTQSQKCLFWSGTPLGDSSVVFFCDRYPTMGKNSLENNEKMKTAVGSLQSSLDKPPSGS